MITNKETYKTKCDYCNNEFDIKDLYSTGGSEVLCEDCLDQNYPFECSGCGGRYKESEITFIKGSEALCEGCNV